MKLSKRIRDLVRAGVASPRRFSGLGKARPPARTEAQLEQIRRSLTRAAAREKHLQDDLALAEQEGRERDAVRLRRDLADLARSTDELQSALDLIEARIEMERERTAADISSVTEDEASPATSLVAKEEEAEGSDLAARKSRLAAPPEEKGKLH